MARPSLFAAETISFRGIAGPLPSDESTHALFPYPARLLRHIPRVLLGSDRIAGGVKQIIDPFCGSGTVLLEARARGIASVGIEQNPVGALISRVKTTPIDGEAFLSLAESIGREAKRTRRKEYPRAYAIKWYSSAALSALTRLRYLIDSLDGPLAEAMEVALLLTARRVSNTDRRIPVPVRPKAARDFASSDVWDAWATETVKMRMRLGRLDPRAPQSRVVLGDSREPDAWATVNDGRASLVFTSPPYGAAQKYIRSTSLDLAWMQASQHKGTVELEHHNVGREHLSPLDAAKLSEPAPTRSIDAFVNWAKEVAPRRAAIYSTYFRDMASVFGQISAHSDRVVLVSGTNVVAGHHIATNAYLSELLVSLGYCLDQSMRDEIRGRSLLTKRRGGTEPSRAEYIDVFTRG